MWAFENGNKPSGSIKDGKFSTTVTELLILRANSITTF
jgi:hypothetical protein